MRAARFAVWSGSTAQLIARSAEQLFQRVCASVWFWCIISGRYCIHSVLQSAYFRGQSVWGGEAGSTGAHKSCTGGARSHRGGRSDWTRCSQNYLFRWLFFNPINYLLFKADFSQNVLVEFLAWVRSLSVKCEKWRAVVASHSAKDKLFEIAISNNEFMYVSCRRQ